MTEGELQKFKERLISLRENIVGYENVFGFVLREYHEVIGNDPFAFSDFLHKSSGRVLAWYENVREMLVSGMAEHMKYVDTMHVCIGSVEKFDGYIRNTDKQMEELHRAVLSACDKFENANAHGNAVRIEAEADWENVFMGIFTAVGEDCRQICGCISACIDEYTKVIAQIKNLNIG